MRNAWRQIGRDGERLHAAKRRLATKLRRHRSTSLLWHPFPLGAQRLFSRERAR